MFIPVSINRVLWVLVVVYPRQWAVHASDSLGNVPNMVINNISRWAKDDMAADGCSIDACLAEPMRCRKQEKGTDCGVIALKWMDYLSSGLGYDLLTGSMQIYWRGIVAELLAKSLG